MRALVIDDEERYRHLLATVLRRLGFDVREAADARAGIGCLRDSPAVELVLVDWWMPGDNGLTVLEHVRGDERLRAAKVVMVTALDEAVAMSAAMVAGADAYLTKPFFEQELVAQLERLELRAAV